MGSLEKNELGNGNGRISHEPANKEVLRLNLGQIFIIIEKIDSETWPTVKTGVLNLQAAAFPAPLRPEMEDLEELVKAQGAVCLVARSNGEVIGFGFGGPAHLYTYCDGVQGDKDTYYLASLAVAVEVRNRGIGTLLRETLASLALSRGFRFMEEHTENSRALARNWCAQVYETYENWSDTGRPFTRTRIDLQQLVPTEQLEQLGVLDAWRIAPAYRQSVATVMMRISQLDAAAAAEFGRTASTYIEELKHLGQDQVLPALSRWLDPNVPSVAFPSPAISTTPQVMAPVPPKSELTSPLMQ